MGNHEYCLDCGASHNHHKIEQCIAYIGGDPKVARQRILDGRERRERQERERVSPYEQVRLLRAENERLTGELELARLALSKVNPPMRTYTTGSALASLESTCSKCQGTGVRMLRDAGGVGEYPCECKKKGDN